jgi:hypothetical protein
MTLTPLRVSTALVLALFAAGCAKSPNTPSATSATWPLPISPANNAQVAYASQPLQLVVTNAVTTGGATPTYSFEVATDSGFSSIVFQKDGIEQGADGRTTLTIDKLAGNATYYWRSHTVTGGGTGPYSKTEALAIGPEVILQIPTPAAPSDSGTAASPVVLTVNNIQRTGPAGPITYRFEVSDSSSFGQIVFSGSAAEQGGGQTSISVTAMLTDGGTYYWRAQALDESNDVVTDFSSVRSFKVQAFRMQDATMWDSPPDLGSWPETAKITSVNFTGYSMAVDFDRRDGPNRWPDTVCCGFAGPIEYTLGMCLNISQHWNCSTVVLFWYGRDLNDTSPPSDFAFQWFYDPARWGPMAGYEPKEGETVGVFVASGNLRMQSFTRATCPTVCERSNVALVPFTAGIANYQF